MPKPKKYEDLDFTPPKGAVDAANRVLKWMEEHPDEIKGITSQSKMVCRKIAKGEPLTQHVIRLMADQAPRKQAGQVNKQFRTKPWKDKGATYWRCFGGNVGVRWAKKMVRKMKKRDKSPNNTFSNRDKEFDHLLLQLEDIADNIDKNN